MLVYGVTILRGRATALILLTMDVAACVMINKLALKLIDDLRMELTTIFEAVGSKAQTMR